MEDVFIREGNLSDADAIARVHVRSWQATYAGILPSELLYSLSVEDRSRRWAMLLSDPAFKQAIFVAHLADGSLVGFATGEKQRGDTPEFES
ncbi:MAG: hypothetical protein EXQ56_12860 [Acidobacteria bacterium]|nr:hypothetical protein [Acidobacteriota bacterium]